MKNRLFIIGTAIFLIIFLLYWWNVSGRFYFISVGKNITIVLDEEIDYAQLSDMVENKSPGWDILDDRVNKNIINYIKRKKMRIMPGTYTLNQSWFFVNGKFVTYEYDRGIKIIKVFEFENI